MYSISMEAARVNAGLSQRDAAKAIGINVGTLSNWENGKTSPDVEKFRRMCKVYECPEDIIFLGKKFALSEFQMGQAER